jgi:hypothetical protein
MLLLLYLLDIWALIWMVFHGSLLYLLDILVVDSLAFFNDLILTRSNFVKKNAFIMGRKPWEITNQSSSFDCELVENVIFRGSMNSALDVLATTLYCLSIEKIFNIVGAQTGNSIRPRVFPLPKNHIL